MVALTDDHRGLDCHSLIKVLPRGAAIIVRRRDPAAALAEARSAHKAAQAQGISLLLSADAWCCGTAGNVGIGLHLPEARARSRQRRFNCAGGGFIVSAAAHGLRAIRQAERIGADFVLVSPIFPTKSHPGASTLGLFRFAALARATHLPVYGLGGLKLSDDHRIRACGGAGVAGVSLFVSNKRP